MSPVSGQLRDKRQCHVEGPVWIVSHGLLTAHILGGDYGTGIIIYICEYENCCTNWFYVLLFELPNKTKWSIYEVVLYSAHSVWARLSTPPVRGSQYRLLYKGRCIVGSEANQSHEWGPHILSSMANNLGCNCHSNLSWRRESRSGSVLSLPGICLATKVMLCSRHSAHTAWATLVSS